MRTYTFLWAVVACTVGGLSAVVAVMSTNPGVLVSAVVLSAFVTGIGAHLVHQERAESSERAALVTHVAVGGAAGLGTAGLVALLGPGWILVDVALVASSPLVLGLLRRLASKPTQVGTPSPPASADTVVPVPTGSMTGTELCRAWRTSSTVLQRLHGGADVTRQAELVQSRQHYLDEMERRDPSGFLRWLEADARPGSDPSKYVDTEPTT